jgi:hypothetical protein
VLVHAEVAVRRRHSLMALRNSATVTIFMIDAETLLQVRVDRTVAGALPVRGQRGLEKKKNSLRTECQYNHSRPLTPRQPLMPRYLLISRHQRLITATGNR